MATGSALPSNQLSGGSCRPITGTRGQPGEVRPARLRHRIGRNGHHSCIRLGQAGENLVAGLGPHKRLGGMGAGIDEAEDGTGQFAHRAEIAAAYGVAWVVVRKANLVTPITGDAEVDAGALPRSMAAGR